MFYKYEIRNNGVEDVLYLFLTMNYEFSKEIGFNSSDKEITRRTKNFINNNGIDYNGDKVYLVIDGIVVKSLDISKNKSDIEVLKENLYYSNDYYMVTIKLENMATIEVNLREYLMGCLASVYYKGLEKETLKALAVLYRTYAFKEMSEDRVIMAFNDFVNYRPLSYYKLSWFNSYDENEKILVEAIKETDCLFLTYNHYYILPFVHFCNYGKTLVDDKYNYLSSVSSSWDMASPYYVNIKDYSYAELGRLLKSNISENSNIMAIEVDSNGFINKLQIDKAIFIGKDIVKLLNLKSRAINIIVNKDYVRFICRGFGYFLGLSIFGANEIAKNGCDYANILKYYFPKVTLNRYIKELS